VAQGSAGADALAALLLARALEWGRRVAPGDVHVGVPPGVALDLPDDELFALEADGVRAALHAATEHVLGGVERPLLVVWPCLPRLGVFHAEAALDDLAHGCEIVIGPVFDGGLYLVGLCGRPTALLDLPEKAWHGPQLIGTAVQAAHDTKASIGLLRPERGLRRAADIRAALADPLLDGELAALLGERMTQP
jgi:hypothetical protein